jgi:xanthine dehydrogenase large subunit
MTSPLHQNRAHDSAITHVSGLSIYVDDIPAPAQMLVAQPFLSPHARASIKGYDLSKARKISGVVAILEAKDIPGHNDIAPFTQDEPLLAVDEVFTEGQAIFIVVAKSLEACRQAMKAITIDFEVKEPILTIAQAIEKNSFHVTPHIIKRGDVEQALEQAKYRRQGTVGNGGQEHFYLESQCALVIPSSEDQSFTVYSSTQHPSEVQAKISEVLHLDRNQIVVESGRMGGGFGGKESQAAHYASYAALAAYHCQKPVKVWLNRDIDMVATGKRHPFWSSFDVGFNEQGLIEGVKIKSFSNGGWACDLSGAILDRCLFHLDGSYWLPALHLEGRVCKTNVASNTAFRGFGGPQGALVIEEILNQIAAHLKLDPTIVKQRNFYQPYDSSLPIDDQKCVTPYGQLVKNNRLQRIFDELILDSQYEQRKASIDRFNESSRFKKRGIGFQPVKFGISFTNSMLNQAGSLILIYTDGSVQLNHGGTEMGQGLYAKMITVCAHELGIRPEKIKHMKTATDKVPNTSATAASSGADLNGMAVQDACRTIKARLIPLAQTLLQVEAHEELIFENQQVWAKGKFDKKLRWEELISQAYVQKISLSATGYYRTPNIYYDRNQGKGKPFHYYAFGASVSEVEVDLLTGEHRLLRVDILHDAGHSLIPNIDKGQVEGAYIQGVGWLTREELYWNAKGNLLTHGPDTYKIPSFSDAPQAFYTKLLDVKSNDDDTIHGSKAVGEPPFLHGIGVISAIRYALQALNPEQCIELPIPATPEAVLVAIEKAKGKHIPNEVLKRWAY